MKRLWVWLAQFCSDARSPKADTRTRDENLLLLLWGALSLTISTAALRALWLEPSLASGFALLLVVYYIVCFFQLIRAAYLPWGCWVPTGVPAIGCA